MQITLQIVELTLGVFFSVQGWLLLELLKLKSKVTVLELIVTLQTNNRKKP